MTYIAWSPVFVSLISRVDKPISAAPAKVATPPQPVKTKAVPSKGGGLFGEVDDDDDDDLFTAPKPTKAAAAPEPEYGA